MYCSTARGACQGLFSVMCWEVLSQPLKIRVSYWTVSILCYPCKNKKGGHADVCSDCNCFYLGNKADLSADGNSAADHTSSC